MRWSPTKGAPGHVDTLTKTDIATWKPGERLLLSGKILTGRDAAHKRTARCSTRARICRGRFHATGSSTTSAPCDPAADEVVGPAGPTTANRMDRFTDTMLGKAGLLAMVGKAERGPETVEAIRDNTVGLSDRRRRRRVPGFQSDPRSRVVGLRRAGHGGDLRIRGAGHAGDRRRELGRGIRARQRAPRLERKIRGHSGRDRMRRVRRRCRLELVLDAAAVGPGDGVSHRLVVDHRQQRFLEVGLRMLNVGHVGGRDAVDASHVLQIAPGSITNRCGVVLA